MIQSVTEDQLKVLADLERCSWPSAEKLVRRAERSLMDVHNNFKSVQYHAKSVKKGVSITSKLLLMS